MSTACKIYHHNLQEISIMKKINILIILIALVLLGCGKDKVKPSEDYLLSTRSIESINNIKAAYEGKKRAVLKRDLSPALAENILDNISFRKVKLTLTTRMVNIKESSVIVNVNWQGSWWVEKDNVLENRGAANLVLDKETMQLIQIEGDNPFSIPISRTY